MLSTLRCSPFPNTFVLDFAANVCVFSVNGLHCSDPLQYKAGVHKVLQANLTHGAFYTYYAHVRPLAY